MKKCQIEVGGLYLARVSGGISIVRVNDIREGSTYAGRATTRYDVTNLKTGRRTTFRSAGRFHGVA